MALDRKPDYPKLTLVDYAQQSSSVKYARIYLSYQVYCRRFQEWSKVGIYEDTSGIRIKGDIRW